VLKAIALFVTLVFLPSAAFAGNDWHLSKDGNRVFFLRSAFAHGYMHGYEEGFHAGDLDLQIGRPFRTIRSQDKFKKIRGYREEFGDRGSFDEGYRKGYAVGYTDAYTGRDFRATQLVKLAKEQSFSDSDATPDRGFDRAFEAGYNTGHKSGLKDGRSAAPLANLDSVACKDISGKDDCAAYRQGYRLGYSDGYTNQSGAGAVLAEK